jgi:hypothetical protein
MLKLSKSIRIYWENRAKIITDYGDVLLKCMALKMELIKARLSFQNVK